jgi:hypothetical protein
LEASHGKVRETLCQKKNTNKRAVRVASGGRAHAKKKIHLYMYI